MHSLRLLRKLRRQHAFGWRRRNRAVADAALGSDLGTPAFGSGDRRSAPSVGRASPLSGCSAGTETTPAPSRGCNQPHPSRVPKTQPASRHSFPSQCAVHLERRAGPNTEGPRKSEWDNRGHFTLRITRGNFAEEQSKSGSFPICWGAVPEEPFERALERLFSFSSYRRLTQFLFPQSR